VSDAVLASPVHRTRQDDADCDVLADVGPIARVFRPWTNHRDLSGVVVEIVEDHEKLTAAGLL
jgi:hypothetical protein